MIHRKSPYLRRRQPEWASLPDPDLLDSRLCDLRVPMHDTVFPRRMERIYREVEKRNLRFRPHYWFGEEWFSPDGIPGIAVPFFLSHPRLMKLEDRQMFEVEGGTESWCMQLLRHETGHAIDSAYRLHRRKLYKKHFGSFHDPYPDYYRPRPLSRNFVRHLDAWYAQSHPAEDFAETFAVWLQPGSRWRRRYAGWPAIKKIEYVEELMQEIAGATPPVRSRRQIAPVSRVRTTLREYYEKKRAHYLADYPDIPERDLLRLFSRDGGRRKAAAFLRRHRSRLRHVVARGTGEHPYTIDQVLKEMTVRCRELDLVLDRSEDRVRLEAAVLLSVRTINYIHRSGRNWIPL